MALIPAGLDATLVLVRHGESRFIVEGRFQGGMESPLSDRGRDQAAAVAARLADPTLDPAIPVPAGAPREIVHSPLGRATETAQAIAAVRSDRTPIRADPAFRELGQGEWEGLTRDEIERRYPDELAAWRRSPTESWAPGGESIAVVADRVHEGLTRIFAGLAGATPTVPFDLVPGYAPSASATPWSILVGHDGIFKVTMLSIFDLPLERFWMWSFELCGLAIVDVRRGRAILRAHNLTGHLAAGTTRHEDAAARAAREASGAL